MNTFLVYLRRPDGIDDRRNDPFWEFGSFGVTRCHASNLLHPRKTPIRKGDRLAFLQGGMGEIRVICLTPAVDLLKPCNVDGFVEVRWDPAHRPLKFAASPLLVNNDGDSDFPAIFDLIKDASRLTWCSKAASKLRSRSSPAPAALVSQIHRWFDQPRKGLEHPYTETVSSPPSPWHERAKQQGWATRSEREKVYLELSGHGVIPACRKRSC
ncbi:MAG: hypothetical protein ABFC67_03150 [Mizugakiibacter sp.]|uniref:hypothetical protein n=1 Tax=Mizugakiibacter sp. TaxID=1972610 RepID=UPI0031BE17B3|nr:hypothetical protein [Xanthomonadaceae bacterium]